MKPIQSQQEADELRKELIKETAEMLKIPADEAEKRLDWVVTKNILGNDPNSIFYRAQVDYYLSIPSDQHGK